MRRASILSFHVWLGLGIGAGVLACGPGKETLSESAASASSETVADNSTTSGTGTQSETTATSETETETGLGDPCELETYAECYTEPVAALHGCLDACGCGDSNCRDPCYAGFSQDYWSCIPYAEQDCPHLGSDAASECHDQCFINRTNCADAGCDDHVCSYDYLWCNDYCRGCPGYAEIGFEYMDSCVLDLPGELPLVNLPYVVVEIEGMPQGLGWSEDMCDGAVEVLWNEDFTSLELCPEACMQFAEAGEVVVVLGSPPCE